MDRSNSFRLGLAPVLQDGDIDTPLIAESSDYPPSMITMMRWLVELARTQGKIRTQLYSPASATLSDEDKARIAEALADETKNIYAVKAQVGATNIAYYLPILRPNVWIVELGHSVASQDGRKCQEHRTVALWRRNHTAEHLVR